MSDALQQIHDKLDRILAAVEKKKRDTQSKKISDTQRSRFEWFWLKAYPHRNGRKLGKQEALEAFCRHVEHSDWDEFKLAIMNYRNSNEVQSGCVKDPVRFFKNRLWSWRDWIEAPKEAPLGDGVGQFNGRDDEQRAKQRFGDSWRCSNCDSQDMMPVLISGGRIDTICRNCTTENTFGG